MTELRLFSLRLSHSGRAIHRVFATQAQEAFLAGHVDAFSVLSRVPLRIRYDNLKLAVARVLLGRDRIESERFIASRSDYGYDASPAAPARTVRTKRAASKATSAGSGATTWSPSPMWEASRN